MKKVLSIILGGGAGTRLYPLTKQRAKPAVPVAGKYRLIDIPVSNCINSEIYKIYVENEKFMNFIIMFLSFGFKYGIPADADLVFDVRFLPNPFYVPELKFKTGLDQLLSALSISIPHVVRFITPSFTFHTDP